MFTFLCTLTNQNLTPFAGSVICLTNLFSANNDKGASIMTYDTRLSGEQDDTLRKGEHDRKEKRSLTPNDLAELPTAFDIPRSDDNQVFDYV